MLERGNPIPAGRYWLNVKMPSLDGGDQAEAFAVWVNDSQGAVKIESTQDGPDDGMAFFIFRVLRPHPRWPLEAGLGIPDRAPDGVRSQDDVIQQPEPEPEAADRITAMINKTASVVGWGFAAYLLVQFLASRNERK